jgi:hypothetical protein
VILADPVAVTPPPKRPSSPNNKVSVENIEEKLKAAEERRMVNFTALILRKRLKFVIQTYIKNLPVKHITPSF